MLTDEERLSRLEGVYKHLATKTDVAELSSKLDSLGIRSSSEIRAAEMRVRLTALGTILTVAIFYGGLAVLGN